MTTSHSLPLILYADQDQLQSSQLEQILERENFIVHCVANGEEALSSARHLLPSIAILNAELPGIGGLEVLRQMRRDASTASIPVIITSSHPRRSSAGNLDPEMHSEDWLYKPFSPRELLARIQKKLQSSQLHTDLQQRTRELEILLQAIGQLNRVKSVNELLDLMPRLTLQLLPGSLVALGRLGKDGQLRSRLVHHQDSETSPAEQESRFLSMLQRTQESNLLNDATDLPPGWTGCMVSVTRHGEDMQANCLVASSSDRYSERQLKLLEGLNHQAVLALHDAQLLEVITKQNMDLEETVRERSADLETAQNMLIHSEKLVTIGHLAAGLAHEINNPLQPIRILLDDMLEDIRDGVLPEAGDVVRIQESIDRITRTVGQVLGFTRRDSEDTVFASLDLADLLRGVVQLNRKLFRQDGLRMEVDLPRLPPVRGNRDQLEQVFINLFLNARSAMSCGNSLTLSASVVQDTVEIRVSDSGQGIAPEHLQEIFEPYFTTREEGRGLGLFISNSIIQKHRGTIRVESVPGEGATFIVHFPVEAGNGDRSS
ncbi:MAG: ATP-binding protein [Anaerolineaceae bacterium]|nr:ATP-binding protein [Anaerolineaceae bacterium]